MSATERDRKTTSIPSQSVRIARGTHAPDQDASFPSESFARSLSTENSQHWVKNCSAHIFIWQFSKDRFVPCAESSENSSDSYVVSFTTHFLRYPAEELSLVGDRWTRVLGRLLIGLFLPLFRLLSMNKIVSFNNWLSPTASIPLGFVKALLRNKESLQAKHRDKALELRGLLEDRHFRELKLLKEKGFCLVPSRQVYLFDPSNPKIFKQRMYKSDQAFLRKSKLKGVEHDDFSPEDLMRSQELYSKLYREKYSRFNPDYSKEYMFEAHRSGYLKFFGFRAHDGSLVAMAAYRNDEDYSTCHIIGYDTDMPSEWSLYRLLFARLMKESVEKGRVLHYSSGAAHFKRLRGAEAQIEYMALAIDHLAWGRRVLYRSIAFLGERFGKRALVKHQL